MYQQQQDGAHADIHTLSKSQYRPQIPRHPSCLPSSLPPLLCSTRDSTGLGNWEAAEGGLRHAIDLVRLIRQEHGDYFGVAVAGHPEGHVDGKEAAAAAEAAGEGQADEEALELQRLKEKVCVQEKGRLCDHACRMYMNGVS